MQWPRKGYYYTVCRCSSHSLHILANELKYVYFRVLLLSLALRQVIYETDSRHVTQPNRLQVVLGCRLRSSSTLLLSNEVSVAFHLFASIQSIPCGCFRIHALHEVFQDGSIAIGKQIRIRICTGECPSPSQGAQGSAYHGPQVSLQR